MSGKQEVWSRSGPKRPNYFIGKLLTAEDLQREQEYHLDKLRQLTRVVLGVGVVDGLRLSSRGQQVTISAGVAVDGAGRVLELPESCRFQLPAGAAAWNVFIGLNEVPCDPQPVIPGNIETDTQAVFGKIQEITRVWIEEATAKPGETVTAGAVWLGMIRVRKQQGGARRKK